MARNPIVFNNGTLVSSAKVEVDGVIYDVDPAQYEGTTPLSANNLNQLQTNLYDYIDEEIESIIDDIYYKSGDTFQWLQSEHSDYELYNQITVGHITAASKQIQFTIALPKKLDRINNITLSSLAISARIAGGGYIFQDADSDLIGSGYTIRVYKRTGNILLIGIERSSGSFGTNNSLVDISIRNIIATFN